MTLFRAGNLIPCMSWTRFRKNAVSRKTYKYSCHEWGAYKGTVLKLLQLITHLSRQPPQPLPLLQSCTDLKRVRLHTVFPLPQLRAIWDLAPQISCYLHRAQLRFAMRPQHCKTLKFIFPYKKLHASYLQHLKIMASLRIALRDRWQSTDYSAVIHTPSPNILPVRSAAKQFPVGSLEYVNVNPWLMGDHRCAMRHWKGCIWSTITIWGTGNILVQWPHLLVSSGVLIQHLDSATYNDAVTYSALPSALCVKDFRTISVVWGSSLTGPPPTKSRRSNIHLRRAFFKRQDTQQFLWQKSVVHNIISRLHCFILLSFFCMLIFNLQWWETSY